MTSCGEKRRRSRKRRSPACTPSTLLNQTGSGTESVWKYPQKNRETPFFLCQHCTSPWHFTGKTLKVSAQSVEWKTWGERSSGEMCQVLGGSLWGGMPRHAHWVAPALVAGQTADSLLTLILSASFSFGFSWVLLIKLAVLLPTPSLFLTLASTTHHSKTKTGAKWKRFVAVSSR